MGLLLKIEWLKIKKYPAFWWMLAIVMLTYPSINYMFYNIYNEFTQGKEMTNNIMKFMHYKFFKKMSIIWGTNCGGRVFREPVLLLELNQYMLYSYLFIQQMTDYTLITKNE